MYGTTNCTPVDQFNINKSSNDANSNGGYEKNSKHPTDSNKMLESIINRKDNKSYQFNLIHSRDRSKRFLIYSGSGVCKLVIGFSIPVKLPDKRRSMGNYLGFHFQFPEITRPIYWWDFFNSTTFAARQFSWQVPLLHNSVTKLLKRDESREYIYKFIQNIFEHRGLNGEQCLYQLICEIGKRPFAVDKTHNPTQIYHEFLNAIFM
ncbi:uncharacterized protein LOC119675667 [Teleopsis dalmanni]|uniref:uncharacterized protein LOC119675667 n=1 Tax=Teleopsis dalmanni TaxID=139649 RepID=UPI0018CDEA18|nr:uncharacterized protein LOC119675667 [Teleopsis dalmanni]